MIPINHINYEKTTGGDILSGDGKCTFRKQQRWISQLDWAIVSTPLLDLVESLSVDQDMRLPTDHASVSLKLSKLKYPPDHLINCAKQLGVYELPTDDNNKRQKTILTKQIDQNKFLENLNLPVYLQVDNNNIHSICEELATTIYKAASAARVHQRITPNRSPQNALDRWNNILHSTNDRQLWSAINWQGHLDTVAGNCTEKPSDRIFCKHFETLLNPENARDPQEYEPQNILYIPVLDDPITIEEVDRCMKKLKSSKAAGTDGISPGIVKWLPVNWCILLTQIFNLVFIGEYPLHWTLMKVFTIFKKGNRTDPGNYRGISILSAIPKLYDMILSSRFALWYAARPEQAGAQPGRSCEEQILTVRLVIDIARKRKRVLYIAFIDYQKAYDKVNRFKLLQYLDQKGCGNQFLNAIKNSMTSIGLIGKEQFSTAAGVKQGGSSSCNLFTAYIDPTIDAVKTFGPDDWLGNLHILLLMDDTIVLATSRQNLQTKLALLKECTDSIGMILHPTKSQFITVNTEDNIAVTLDDVTISKTEKYVYLGAEISNQPIATQVKQHATSKAPHIRKFYSFLAKNSDAPFPVKLKVWKSALNAALLYSSETWLTNDLRSIETPYNNSLKQMLSCRQTTSNDIVYIETGQPNVKCTILDRQMKFLKKLRQRGDYITDIINMAIRSKSPMGKRIEFLSSLNESQSENFMRNLKETVSTSDSSRRITYHAINPTLTPSNFLQSTTIQEPDRIAVTRLRVGSHYLRIETGRWSRTPPDQRTCSCNTGIQNEQHVLLECPRSHDLRRTMNLTNYRTLSELFKHEPIELAEYCKLILNLFRT